MSTGSPTRTAIGPYRITGFLGAGGMGEVWRGVHRELQRDVAIKRLSDSAAAGVSLERFRNEARLHGTLNHPRIAQLYDFIVDDGAPCIVMEYVAGPTIEQQLRQGAMPLHIALPIVEMVAEAAGYLHQRGIVHRDIKPSNVKLRPDGSPVLLDFGIARADGDPRLTRTGMIVGTPQALAPEQFEGKTLDGRSDIWSIGVLLYEMVTGVPPFTGDSIAVLASAILSTTAVTPSARLKSLPPRLDAVIARCLDRDRSRRYQTTEELIVALQELRRVTPRPGDRATSTAKIRSASRRLPRPLLLGAAAAMVTALVTAAVVWSRPSPTVEVPVAPVTPSILPSGSGSPSANAPAEMLTTRISIVEGAATVLLNGQAVGSTPYIHSAPVGTHVTLTLRRAGYRDETVTFIVSNNQREYTLVMQRDSGTPVAPALIGWLGWFRRRPRAGAQARSAQAGVTGERAAAKDLRFVAASRSDVGCVRDGNEDAVSSVVLPDGSLVAILCDGMGGHAAGEVAAALAISAIEARAGELNTADALVGAVDAANVSIRRAVAADQSLRGMGTTCVVLRLAGQTALCAHVGDSRAYLVRDGGIYRLTEDHSHVRALVRDGSLADRDARHHPDKNVILRALGPADHVTATTFAAPLQLRAGDRFLLSSDGLHDLADDLELMPALALREPLAACDALVALARERGAPDNVSVCVIDATASAAALAETRAIEAVT
jgi:serine/threonine protein kinase/serine/threonine protein phosphatase PrpC